MDVYRPIARYIARPLYAIRNRNAEYKYVAASEAAQYMPEDRLQEHQLAALRAMLIHARDTTPFYAKRFAEVGFRPERMQSVTDIQALPLLTKSDIQQHREEMLASTVPRDTLISNQTGGSTGAPLKFYHDPDCMNRRRASTIRHDRWAGLEMWDKAASIWGHRRDFLPPSGTLSKIRDRILDRRIVLDTSDITPARLAEFVAVLKKEQPTVYIAYANAIYLLARYIKETGITDHSRPRSIITSAEVLTPEQREVIETVFECPVFDRYGCREVSVIASECERHEGLHLCSDRLLVEFVANDRPARPGELGSIVITDLYNFGMPFIRYQIKDMGAPAEKACSCGRTLPLMKMMGGRVTDFLISPEGTVVSGAAMTIYFVATVPGVAQAQLIQREPGRLIIRLVKGPAFNDSSHDKIREAVAKFFGPKMTYELDAVEEIPLEASGKYRFSICELDPLEYLT